MLRRRKLELEARQRHKEEVIKQWVRSHFRAAHRPRLSSLLAACITNNARNTNTYIPTYAYARLRTHVMYAG
jgi:hypothetical protein